MAMIDASRMSPGDWDALKAQIKAYYEKHDKEILALLTDLQPRKDQSNHAPWKSPQAPNRDPLAASDPGDEGTSAGVIGASIGANPYITGYLSSSIVPSWYASQSNTLAAANAGGLAQQAGFGLALQNAAHLQQALSAQNMPSGFFFPGYPEPEEATLPTEIKAGELTAWRAWRLSGAPAGHRLLSMIAMASWEPGTPMTGDIKGGLGVHAWKTEEQARAYAIAPWCVVGEVELWGQVIEHEDGYRAEYASIKSLHPTRGLPSKHLHEVRVRYGLVPEGAKAPRWIEPVYVVAGACIVALAFALWAPSSPWDALICASAGVLGLFATLTDSEG